jgi:hypothetical protein
MSPLFTNSMKYNTTRKKDKEQEAIGLVKGIVGRPAGGTKPAFALTIGPDERDLLNDPIHIYLREIGKVSLLTAKEEQSLAGKIEESKYLAKIETLHLEYSNGISPQAGVMLYLLRHLINAVRITTTIFQRLGLAHEDSFNRTIRNPKLRAVIDGIIEEEFIESIAGDNGKIASEVWQDFKNLSIYSRLLPAQVFDIIGDETSWAEVEALVTDPVNAEFLVKLRHPSRSRKLKDYLE